MSRAPFNIGEGDVLRIRLQLPYGLRRHAVTWTALYELRDEVVRYYGGARWARRLFAGLEWPVHERRLGDEAQTLDVVRVEWAMLACEWARKARTRRERWQRVHAALAVDALAATSHDAAKAIERLAANGDDP